MNQANVRSDDGGDGGGGPDLSREVVPEVFFSLLIFSYCASGIQVCYIDILQNASGISKKTEEIKESGSALAYI